MSQKLTIDAVARAMAEDVSTTFAQRLGADASAAPSDAPATEGWTLTVAVSGACTGRVVLWIDRASADACARAILKTEATPSETEVLELISAMVQDVTLTIQKREGFDGAVFAAPVPGQGTAPAGARAFYVAAPNVASCLIAVGVERAATNVGASDERLGAVLGVDLPLVVRFGRTTLPMRAIAELGPGAMIDMGRPPDEPVDVLVGERLIARGEVVVVGGNYGVRITSLASGRDAGAN